MAIAETKTELPGAPALATLADARILVGQQVARIVEPEEVPLASAGNRILAQDLASRIDVPPHDCAAVDGYAVRRADLSPTTPVRLRVIGRAAAGHPLNTPIGPGAAAQILTGAPLPSGADFVLMQEYCRSRDGAVLLPPLDGFKNHLRRRASDVAAGQIALRAGIRLRPQDIALAAAIGYSRVSVFACLKVALFSTGDEVREPGTDLQPGEIWDANRLLLNGLLSGLGCVVTDKGILSDSPRDIEGALRTAAGDHDLILTSGGMSVGSEDHLTAVIKRRGTLDLWRIAMKPGKPIGIGDIDACPILSLPGNPVAALVAFVALGRTVVSRLSGAIEGPAPSLRLAADFAFEKKPGRREFLFGELAAPEGGVTRVRLLDKQGAAMLAAAAQTQGFVVLDEPTTRVIPGQPVDFLPIAGLTS
ncbi:MAG: molybdopterin molybdotransferase MoeA [Alphaproteobacteria bacterium]|nr:molybdopterin molybdotransferase MoeA [Alphaproteobacteria bacterium]